MSLITKSGKANLKKIWSFHAKMKKTTNVTSVQHTAYRDHSGRVQKQIHYCQQVLGISVLIQQTV